MHFFFSFVYCSASACQRQYCRHDCPSRVEYFTTHRPTLVPGPVEHGTGSEPERHKRLLSEQEGMNGAEVRP